MRVIVGVSPYGSCAEAKKLRDPPGIPTSNVIVLITDHSHILFVQGSQGITLENRHWSLLYKIYGDKSAGTAFLFEHVIISYLLCLAIVAVQALAALQQVQNLTLHHSLSYKNLSYASVTK